MHRQAARLRSVSYVFLAAAGADNILAEPGTLTGSIGVASKTWDLTDGLKSIGVDVERVGVGANAASDDSNLLSRPTEKQEQQSKEHMDRSDLQLTDTNKYLHGALLSVAIQAVTSRCIQLL